MRNDKNKYKHKNIYSSNPHNVGKGPQLKNNNINKIQTRRDAPEITQAHAKIKTPSQHKHKNNKVSGVCGDNKYYSNGTGSKQSKQDEAGLVKTRKLTGGRKIKGISLANNKNIVIYDSGSDINLCNNKNLYINKSIRPKTTIISGIDAEVTDNNKDINDDMVSYEEGDVMLRIGTHDIILTNVAYVDYKLDNYETDSSRNTLLISVKWLAKYNNTGTFFKAGGELIEFYDHEDVLLEAIEVSFEEPSYINRGKSVNFDQKIDDLDTTPKFRIRKKKVRKPSQRDEPIENFSKTDIDFDGNLPTQVGTFGKNNHEKTTKQNASFPNKKRQLLLQKLHNRIHFLKTGPVVSFLKRVYGLDTKDFEYFFENNPCDGCNTAKATFSKVYHRNERPAPTRPGEWLGFDIFTSPVRTPEGIKYILLIIDIYTGYIWIFPLQKKSETKRYLITLIKRLERRGRKTKAITPIIEGLRGDGGGENFTKELTKLTAEIGISLEESLPYSQYQNGSA